LIKTIRANANNRIDPLSSNGEGVFKQVKAYGLTHSLARQRIPFFELEPSPGTHRKHTVRGTVWCSGGGGDHISSDWFSVHGQGNAGSAPSIYFCRTLMLPLLLLLSFRARGGTVSPWKHGLSLDLIITITIAIIIIIIITITITITIIIIIIIIIITILSWCHALSWCLLGYSIHGRAQLKSMP
jgi:hypothetical protein